MIPGMRILCRIFVIASVLAGSTACATGESFVELKGQRYSVEIADDREEQAMGLMFRDSMPPDHGMLFIFRNESPRSFWMKNTRIPLDIMYFSSSLELINVAKAVPCRVQQCPPYPSEGPAMYVLELNAGTASELGLVPGDVMTLALD
jgi:uncharacterized membrane protein (UPF0127 family)